MKETLGTLKQYLVWGGLIGVLSNLPPLLRGIAGVAALMSLGNVTLSFCYLLLGVRFRDMLASAPSIVFRLFYVTIAWSVTCVCLAYLVGDESRAASGAILGGLLGSYCVVNIRRIVATNLITSGQ